MITRSFASIVRSTGMCCAALLTAASASFGATGVCCIPNLTCAIADSSICLGAGGVYKGDNTTCSPVNPCEVPRGACCIETSRTQAPPYGGGGGKKKHRRHHMMLPLGGSEPGLLSLNGSHSYTPQSQAGPIEWESDPIICLPLSEITCVTNDGTYAGDNVACTPTYCLPPAAIPGACCIVNSQQQTQCVGTIQSECPAGAWTANVSCTPNPCPAAVVGGCCRVEPSHVANCFITAQINCLAGGAGNTYLGDGSTCSATSCPQPVLGSCCRAATANQGASCTLEYSNFCVGAGSVFTPSITACNTTPCAGACPCDWNHDGFVTGADVTAFLGDWLAGHGDYDHSGATNTADYTAFVQCYGGPSTSQCLHR